VKWFRRDKKEAAVWTYAFNELARERVMRAYVRQVAFEGAVGDDDWTLDQETGLLVIGDTLKLPIQILGSYSAGSRTWLWAWANPSVDDALVEKSRELLEFGRTHDVPEFLEAEFSLGKNDESDVVAMVSSDVLGGSAYYPAAHSGGRLFMLPDIPSDLMTPRTPSVIEMISAVTVGSPYGQSRDSVVRFLSELGMRWDERDGMLRLSDSQSSGTIAFDELGRLANLDVKITGD
jgi:hypothetical protein